MRPMHPLAMLLSERLAAGARVLDIGRGSGRNADGLTEAGFLVVSTRDGDPVCADANAFDGAIATHALLHGSHEEIARTLRTIAGALAPRAPFHATFGSTSDLRFGAGTRLDERTYAPASGDESGVPHTFYDESEVRSILHPDFEIESLTERAVDDVAGRWAHAERPLRGARHWFAIARRR